MDGEFTMESSKHGKHKEVYCKTCKKTMRSDNLKKHVKTHIKKQQQKNIEINLINISNLETSNEIGNLQDVTLETSLRDILLKDNEAHKQKIELGKQIYNILEEDVIQEASLTREYKLALDLYRKQRPKFDVVNKELRPWQEQALKLIEHPSERQVIWITGRQGNEGKTWFQCYLESYFGFNRVFRTDLRIKHANVCNILKKRNLGTVDIFLFNDSRSVTDEEMNLYRILEDIKDGQATASKYNNDNIRFKTPNIVMVFSNCYPNTKKLSKDRWIIYNANKDGLNDVTMNVMKMRKDGYKPNNTDKLSENNM